VRSALPPLRATLGVKLALAVFAIVAGALAIVYLLVVPRLEEQLVDAKVRQLERSAPRLVAELRQSSSRGIVGINDTVSFAATNLNARIVVFDRLGTDGLRTIADSSVVQAGDLGRDRIARQAAEGPGPASGRVEREGLEYAEHSVPVGSSIVVLFSAPLEETLANVRLVRRSVVIAGLVALLAAAAAAYAAAIGLTRRLRRLETAADRIARGDFATPVAETRGGDEVAELARGFDAMRERLSDLDRVRREFIANASHELRTPLFSLAGFLELLADEELDPPTRREFLQETRAQVERLTRLATDLLDLSRLDAGQLSVERGEVDLTVAARTVCEEFRALAEATGHPLSVEAADDVLAVGDYERVIQIGRILVENALRHTTTGTRIELHPAFDNGRATLAVTDKGPGIAAEDQEHVFERFYRAGGGRASGSGLGLAIARELATRMDGTLDLSSQPGETVLRLCLPAVAPIPRGNGEPAAAREPATTL